MSRAKTSKTTQGGMTSATAQYGTNKKYTKGANAAIKAGKSGMAVHRAGQKAASNS